MIVIGLTGGIATGKSTVAAFLSRMGARVIDADKLAHAVYRKGLPAWQAIVDEFGQAVLAGDGQIDRGKLGQIVFGRPDKKKTLNAIVHPLVKGEIRRCLQTLARKESQSLVVLDVPLLFEAGMDQGLAEVIVVYTPEAIQLERLMRRDGLNQHDALARIRSQMPIEEKKERATLVIDNSRTVSDTRLQTQQILETIRSRYGIG